jgi:hypothetical protein
MGNLTVLALRGVLTVLLAGSVFVQTVMVALLAADMAELEPALQYLRIPLIAIMVLGIATAQIVLVCVWRLATMVRRRTVFSHGAFRYVDAIIGAFVVAGLLVFALAVLLASANHRIEGDAIAPGLVLLICGVAVAVWGIALTVLLLRLLLAQAIARDIEAAKMQNELAEVI